MAPVGRDSLFAHLETAPYDEIFGLLAAFKDDPCPGKVSLGAGVYRDNEARSWRLQAVREAEQLLLDDPSVDHEYLPIAGFEPFISAARDLIFGGSTTSSSAVISPNHIASIQTISGTGANHIGARFLADHLPPAATTTTTTTTTTRTTPRKIWISDPTWANHHLIWDLVVGDGASSPPSGSSGNSNSNISSSGTNNPIVVCQYPYFHQPTRSLDFTGMMRTLDAEATPGDVILLHACAHNPTGVDPTRNQWREIATLCESKGVFPFFDCAYQGFASGDLEADVWALREFAARGMELCVAQSFSKNLGLYGQRVGAFHLVCRTPDAAKKARSQIIELQRGEISMPPVYGVRIAEKVLSTPHLYSIWQNDLVTMSSRIKAMRRALYDELKHLHTPGTWEHIIDQIGMFSYTGLTTEQVDFLAREYHIYMLASGRMSISGLNTSNVKYVAKAFDAAVRQTATASNGH